MRSTKHELMLRFRKRRNRALSLLIDSLPSPIRVLDVGGTPFFWESIKSVDKCRVTILNKQVSEKEKVYFETGNLTDFELRIGDACAMPEMATGGFDLVVCNSVLEHVGAWDKMVDAAHELVRVGQHGWVQVPAFEFPLEVHHLIPFVHWFGTPIRRAVVGMFYPGSLEEMRAWVDINLVTRKEMRVLFPGARIYSERFALLPKSHIAVW